MNTYTKHLMTSRWSPRNTLLSGLAVGLLAVGALAAPSQILADSGFDSDSQPLLGFTQPNVFARWLQEKAVLVVGSENGVTPYAGDGMIGLAKTILTGSQIRQRLDVSALSVEIDAGIVCMDYQAWVNPTVSGVIASLNGSMRDVNQQVLGSFGTGDIGADGDKSTWEQGSITMMVPPGTRYIECQVGANNASLPTGESLYADGSVCTLSVIIQPEVITDGGFDSNSQLLLPFTTTNVFSQWLQENAVLVTGTQGDGAMPYAGDGMIQLAKATLVASQIRQRVDVSAHASAIDAGLVSMNYSAMVNPTVSGVIASLNGSMRDVNQQVLSSFGSGDLGADGDTSTWEQGSISSAVPPGTRYIEFQVGANNASLPSGQYLYADEATATLKAAPVCFRDVFPGHPGTYGDPLLDAQVSLGSDAVGTLELSNANENAPVALFIGIGPVGPGVPFKGGILKPVPWLLLLTGLITDANGDLDLSLNIGLPWPGLSLVFQYGIADPGASVGVSLSNTLQMDIL